MLKGMWAFLLDCASWALIGWTGTCDHVETAGSAPTQQLSPTLFKENDLMLLIKPNQFYFVNVQVNLYQRNTIDCAHLVDARNQLPRVTLLCLLIAS